MGGSRRTLCLNVTSYLWEHFVIISYLMLTCATHCLLSCPTHCRLQDQFVMSHQLSPGAHVMSQQLSAKFFCWLCPTSCCLQQLHVYYVPPVAFSSSSMFIMSHQLLSPAAPCLLCPTSCCLQELCVYYILPAVSSSSLCNVPPVVVSRSSVCYDPPVFSRSSVMTHQLSPATLFIMSYQLSPGALCLCSTSCCF